MNNTYPEDFFLLQRQIVARKLDENLMQAAIVGNPHQEKDAQEEFINTLLKQRRFYRPEDEPPVETDFEGIKAFKQLVQKESRVLKAK